MSTKYKATENDRVYFITITVVGWIDVYQLALICDE